MPVYGAVQAEKSWRSDWISLVIGLDKPRGEFGLVADGRRFGCHAVRSIARLVSCSQASSWCICKIVIFLDHFLLFFSSLLN